ncbi:MAG TPA: hypothetical protein VF433_01865, partial [Cellvibrio sp.]
EVDNAALKLKGESLDYSNSAQGFIDGLEGMGVKVTDDGVSFKKSDIDEFPTDRKIVLQTIARLKSAKDAEDIHKIKRFIDNKVAFGKSSEGGITRDTVNLLKQLRHNIDTDLDGKFPDYDKANTKYAKTIGAINDMQDASGTIDLFGEGSEKAIGTRLRTLLSNQQRRQDMANAISTLDSVASELGGKFDDNIGAQIAFANAVENAFNVGAKTSLKGEVSQGVKDATAVTLGQKTASGVVMEKAANLVEKARGVNKQNALKSLRDLVKE